MLRNYGHKCTKKERKAEREKTKTRRIYVNGQIFGKMRRSSGPLGNTIDNAGVSPVFVSPSSQTKKVSGRKVSREIGIAGSQSPMAELRERPRPASTENFYSEHEVLRMIDNLHAEKVLQSFFPIHRCRNVNLMFIS